MKTTTTAIPEPPSVPAPGSAVLRLRDAVGIEKANCHSCGCGFADNDGDMCTIYCGMVCTKRDHPELETYLEDQGVDLDTEKTCWEPDFWQSRFAEMLDGAKASERRATKAFRRTLEYHDPQNGALSNGGPAL